MQKIQIISGYLLISSIIFWIVLAISIFLRINTNDISLLGFSLLLSLLFLEILGRPDQNSNVFAFEVRLRRPFQGL